MAKLDWRLKYTELRSKYMNALDQSYQIGIQEGQRQAELQNLQMQLEQAQQQTMAAQQASAMDGMPGEEIPPEEQAMMEEEGGEMPPEMMGEEGVPEEGGDELDQSMDELEDLVSKAEKPNAVELLKKIHSMRMTKSEIGEKKVLVKQRNIVDSIMKKWDEEASKKEGSISEILESIKND